MQGRASLSRGRDSNIHSKPQSTRSRIDCNLIGRGLNFFLLWMWKDEQTSRHTTDTHARSQSQLAALNLCDKVYLEHISEPCLLWGPDSTQRHTPSQASVFCARASNTEKSPDFSSAKVEKQAATPFIRESRVLKIMIVIIGSLGLNARSGYLRPVIIGGLTKGLAEQLSWEWDHGILMADEDSKCYISGQE